MYIGTHTSLSSTYVMHAYIQIIGNYHKYNYVRHV